MFNILKRFFNRRANTVRECPECGFKGNPKQFKKVKIMTTTTAKVDDRHNSGSNGSAGSGGNVGSGNPAPEATPPSSDDSSAGSAGSAGSDGSSGS